MPLRFIREFSMNVIPLYKDVEKPKERIKNMGVTISGEWWESTYSINFTQKENTPIYKFQKKKVQKFPSISGWDIAKGDYRVPVSKPETRDYVYYRDLKIKLFKYSIYPAVIITMLVIFFLSDLLSAI